MLRRAPGVAGIALVSLVLGACDLAMSGFHEEARDTWSKTYPLASNGRLEIVNTNGGITVEPTDSARVEVHAERVARAATQQGAKELLQKLQVQEEAASDRVHLEMRVPGLTGFGHGGVEVRYTVHVPRTCTVDLRQTNGQLDVSGLTRETRLRTTNGNVTGRNLDGEVHAATTNGRVELQMASISQDVEAETTNGSIAVAVPTDAGADVSARVTNGHIAVDGLPSLKPEDENSRRRFSGRLNGGGHTIRLQTTNGTITISGRGAASTDSGTRDKQAVER